LLISKFKREDRDYTAEETLFAKYDIIFAVWKENIGLFCLLTYTILFIGLINVGNIVHINNLKSTNSMFKIIIKSPEKA